MKRQLVIDENECEGCETCVELCPEVFTFNEETQAAEVLDPDAKDECIEEAMDSCPAECIRWEEV